MNSFDIGYKVENILLVSPTARYKLIRDKRVWGSNGIRTGIRQNRYGLYYGCRYVVVENAGAYLRMTPTCKLNRTNRINHLKTLKAQATMNEHSEKETASRAQTMVQWKAMMPMRFRNVSYTT